jgi:hypothetical protein
MFPKAAMASPSTRICMPRYFMSQRESVRMMSSSFLRLSLIGHSHSSFSRR